MSEYELPPPPLARVGPGRRLVARFIDGLVLILPVLLVTLAIAGDYQLGTEADDGSHVLAGVVGVLVTYAYFVVLESSRGATLGKSAMGFDLVTDRGGLPTPAQSAQRNSWMLLSLVPGTFGGLLYLVAAVAIAVTIASDPRGQGVHDRWAGVRPVPR